jgi:sulfite reductase beta subunit-like hemoprotein
LSGATVGIQFCGGCNPRIDRGQIARELQQELEGMGHRVVFNSPDADLVIFLSGCMSGCAFKFNPKDPPYVTVAAATVDGEEVGEARIVPEVLRKVRQYHERLETEIRKENHDGRRGSHAG